jgi:hypothetical protein
MSYIDHLKICSDCQKRQRPTVRIKGASAHRRERKLSELAALISGVSYPTISYASIKTSCKTKAASSIEKSQKLKELARLIRGL